MPDRNDKRQASRLASGSFDDPEAYVGTVGYRSANVVVHRAPDFAGWLARLDLDGVRLYRSDHNASMSVMSATAEPAFAFSTDRRSRARIAGRDFGFGTIYCIGPDRPFHCSAEGHLAWGSVGFDPDRLAADLEVLRGRPSPGIGHGAMFDASATPGWARLLTASETAVRIGMTAPAALATGSAAANLADTLTGALMDCLETGGLDPDRASIRRHHQILERMLAAIEADHATELTLTRLCRPPSSPQHRLLQHRIRPALPASPRRAQRRDHVAIQPQRHQNLRRCHLLAAGAKIRLDEFGHDLPRRAGLSPVLVGQFGGVGIERDAAIDRGFLVRRVGNRFPSHILLAPFGSLCAN